MYILCQLNLSRNLLCRLNRLSVLDTLRVLDLSYNRIQTIDGVHHLRNLETLALRGNQIQKFPLLPQLPLQFLDLSENQLSYLPNVSTLFDLETLLLDSNQISQLETAGRCLPHALSALSLASNHIRDLTQISYLSGLVQLEEIWIGRNASICQAGDSNSIRQHGGFNYRPYLVCCCPSAKVIDGYIATETELLRGEWLYSQGKGRKFLPGQHDELVAYLATVCPLLETHGLTTSTDDKLMRVLAKRREYVKDGAEDWRPLSVPVGIEASFPISTQPRPDNMQTASRTSSMHDSVMSTSYGSSNPDHQDLTNDNVNPYDAYDSRPVALASHSPFYQVLRPELISLRSVGSDIMIFPLDNGQFELTGYQYEVDVPADTPSSDASAGPVALQPIRIPTPRLAIAPANAGGATPAPALPKTDSKHRFFVTLGEWSRDGKIHPLKSRPEKMIILTEGDSNLGYILAQLRDYFNDQSLQLYTARFHVVPDDESSQGLANWKERTKNRTRHFAAPPPPSSDSEESEDEDTSRRQSRKRSAKRVAQKIKHLGKAYKPNCTICYEVLRTDEASKSCNLCGHMFHEDCIAAWLVANPEKCAHCGSEYVSFFKVRLD